MNELINFFVCGEIELWMRNIIYFHQSSSSKFDILGCEIVNCYWYLTRTHSCFRRGYSDLHSHYLSTYQKWLGVDSDFWSSSPVSSICLKEDGCFQVFWLGWDEVPLDQAVLRKNILPWKFYTISLKWIQWQSDNLYFAFEPSCRLEMAVTICIDFQRANNSKYTITQRTRPLMGAWETFVSHTDALQSISLNVSLNLW